MTNNSTASVLEGTNPSNVWIAVVYLAASIGFAAIYLPSLVVMIKTWEIHQHSSYKIMIAMGVYDIMQMIILGPVSAGILLGNEDKGKFSIFGDMLLAGYYPYVTSIIILAMERCIKTWSPKYLWEILFGGIKIYLWIGFTAVVSVPYFARGVSSENYLYITWIFSGSKWLIVFDKTISYGGSVLVFGCYVLILVKLKLMRLGSGNATLEKHEMNILYQSLCTTASLIFAVSFWDFAVKTLQLRLALVACHLAWLVNNGMNGIIYVSFNKTLRDEAKKLFDSKVAPRSVKIFTMTAKKSTQRLF